MAVPNTSVDVAGMKLAQGNFQNALDQVNTAYKDMDEERSTLAANWSGESSSAFGQALEAWLQDLNAVQQDLSNVLENLSHHTNIYANTHEQSTAMANAFAQGLPGLNALPGLSGR
jgi:WXG100 family type VII secretion target